MSLKNAWKNKDVFEKQLSFNRNQLSSGVASYAPHWREMIRIFSMFQPKTVLDIGCGVGAIYSVVNQHFPQVKYEGCDHSEDAIGIAKKEWGNPSSFFVQDFWELTAEFIQQYECILESACIDVMPDGDKAMAFLLNLKPRNLYLQRLQFTDQPSYYREYKAYDEIDTCQYYHNYDDFLQLIDNYDYQIFVTGPGNAYPTGVYLKGN